MDTLTRGGYCRVPRCIEAGLKKTSKARSMGVFLWMLLHAVGGESERDGLRLQRGQLFVRVRDLAQHLGTEYSEMRRSIDELCTAQLMTRQTVYHTANGTTNRGTLITICNFDRYNGVTPMADTTPGTSDDTTHGALSNETETKEERTKETIAVADIPKAMMSHTQWAERYCMNNHLTPSQLQALLEKFTVNLQNSGIARKTTADTMRHFSNWHAKRREGERQRQQQATQQAQREQQRLDEWRTQQEAARTRALQEQAEAQERFKAELTAKAAAGDTLAQSVLRQQGLTW